VDLDKNEVVKNIEVGLHPSGMTLSPDGKKLYVACANSDIISVIDTESDEVTETISVHRDEEEIFGSSSNDLVLSPDGSYLYVACGTMNAICVIRTVDPTKPAGYIPTGWYPGSVILNSSGSVLYVANVKGVGSRNQRTGKYGYNSHDHLGTISIIRTPGSGELKKMTRTVEMNNSWIRREAVIKTSRKKNKMVPVPVLPDQGSLIKHVVYIIKENRTYDQVFGDLPQGNGDTSLVMFGRVVTPNHHDLAEKFVLLDNFYCSGVLSADGHQWTDEAFVTDYLEKSFGDFSRSYPYDGNDALAYASSGFIWDNVLKHGLTFRDYGEFVKAVIRPRASFSEIYKDYVEGTSNFNITAEPNLEQLAPYICPTYISFPNIVSDQYRATEFIRELKKYEENGNLPNFIIMALPADHTSGTRPGMPTPRAAVADNDLALGRIVEAISESKFWNETCILVTEDDPQDGFDHVDGHRTVGLVISPYSRLGKTVSTYYSQISMVRTIENILGLSPMNQLDQSAEPMSDCFSNKPDLRPYKAIENNIPLDQLNPPLVSLSGDQRYWAERSLEQDLDKVDLIDEDVFNRIIWHSVKGYGRPYPDLKK
jgi:YVTN family beta-propeller protein